MADIQYDDVSGAIEIKLKNGRTLSTGKFTMAEALRSVEAAFRSGSFSEPEFNEASALMAAMSRTGGSRREAVDQEAWGANGRSGAAQETVTPPTITDAQVEVINNLILQIKSGRFTFLGQDRGLSLQEGIERQLRSILGLRDTAIGWAQVKQVYDTLVAPELGPDFVFGAAAAAADPAAAAAAAAAADPAEEKYGITVRTGLDEQQLALLQRRLDAQSGEDILRRVAQEQYGLGSGEFSGLTRRALTNPFNRFAATDPIMQFNQPTPFDKSFATFLGQAAPTREQLGTQLSSIISSALGGEDVAGALEGTFLKPTAETAFGRFQPAFSAAIQPTVAGVAPRFQGNVESILQNQFQNRLATDPLRFNTALQVFQDFQNRGFIPQSPVAGP
jgi:hypothetical protein